MKSDPEHAVSYVSWDDAVEFCRKLSEKKARQYRLPTEAQWEYACRAGSRTRFSFGDDGSDLGSYAWYCENTNYAGETYPHQVGRKRANSWGFYNMHGNVMEWCSDRYGSDFGEGSPVNDPTGPSSGSGRVVRGGGWFDYPRRCRSADRYFDSTGSRSDDVGFRVALDSAERAGGA